LQASSRHKVDGKTRKEWQKVCNAKYWLTFIFHAMAEYCM
jgi:hypothetical protein